MGGQSSGQTTQVQQSRSEPWAPTQPLLTDVIGGLNNQYPNTGVTPQESSALGQIQSDAQGLPNFLSPATGFVGNLLNGGGPDRTGTAQSTFNTYQGQLQPYLDPGYLDPTQAPGIAKALQTVRSDAVNNINGMWAGAGRDPSGSGGATQNISEGIARAEAPLLLGQYNTNVNTQRGAQDALYGAGNTTTGILSGLDQTKLGNQGAAFNYIPQLATTDTSPYASLNASSMERQLPLTNYAQLLNLLLPISGLGGQVNTQSSGTSQNQMSGANQFATIAGGLGRLFG